MKHISIWFFNIDRGVKMWMEKSWSAFSIYPYSQFGSVSVGVGVVVGLRSWLKFHSLKMIKGAFSTTFYSASAKWKGKHLKVTICAFHRNTCDSTQIHVIILNAIWPFSASTPLLSNAVFSNLKNLRPLLKLSPCLSLSWRLTHSQPLTPKRPGQRGKEPFYKQIFFFFF